MNNKKCFIVFTGIVLLLMIGLFVSCGAPANVKADSNAIKPGVYKKGNVVLFVYKPVKNDITNVAITGDFNGWLPQGVPMTFENGIWKVTLTLESATYQYKYILNKTVYVPDPTASASAPDGKGGKNSIIEITGL